MSNNTKAKIDDSHDHTEEVDEMNIISNDDNVVSDIDVVGWLTLFSMGYFENITVWGGGGGHSNFVASGSITQLC